MTTQTIRSPQVHHIVRLERQALRQIRREARAMSRATRYRRRAQTLRFEAWATELHLSRAERAELACLRDGLARRPRVSVESPTASGDEACAQPVAAAPGPTRHSALATRGPSCPYASADPLPAISTPTPEA